MRAIAYLVLPLCFSTALMAEELKEPRKDSEGLSGVAPAILVADGLNADGSLIENYQRGLRYAIGYFGNYGPYYSYLLGPDSEQSVREIYRRRAESRVNPNASTSAEEQIDAFLKRPNVVAEMEAVLSGKAEGGLTWTQDPPLLFEDVTTNAKERERSLDEESYWEAGGSPTVYYMIGAWATAYLIHVQGTDEVTVLKDWYHDIPRMGKAAAFEKHMGLSLADFYRKFDEFIRQSDEEVMEIFNKKKID